MATSVTTLSSIKPKIELVIVNNAMAYAFDVQNSEIRHGDNLFDMVQAVYPNGLPLNTYLYHGEWDSECDITPQTANDIDKINRLIGRFFIVTYPAAVVPLWAVVAISIGVSLAVAFLMPMPQMPTGGNGQPPSPNNALAQRSNRQRIGGRVEDIYGEVWSLPSLLAQVYSVYINNQQIELSFMCVGRGYFDVRKACDDTTPINQIMGATVLVFDPNTSINDTPKYRFGSDFTPDEASLSRLMAKRYTSVNGQTLAPPNNYLKGQGDIYFSNGNMIKATSDSVDFTTQFSVGSKITVENANNLPSANDPAYSGGSGTNLIAYNRLVDGEFDANGQPTSNAPNCYDPTYYSVSAGQSFVFTLSANGASNGIYGVVAFYDSNKNLINMVQSHHVDSFTSVSFNAPANSSFYRYSLISRSATATLTYSQTVTNNTKPTYNFNGVYVVSSVSKNQIVLNNPASVASDWTRLNNTTDQTKPSDVILSTANQTLYQGWFYTDLKDHENILLNFKAPNGLYTTYGSEWVPISVELEIESELVDVNGNFIANTNHITKVTLKSPNYDKYLDSNGKPWIRSSDESVRNTVAVSAFIDNPNFGTGKLLRFRVRRSSNKVNSNKGQVIQEVKIVDFYGVRRIYPSDTPSGVTTVYAKTLATEGALSVKERKLRLLVHRYVRDWRNVDSLILSKRIDDIIYDIATDPKTGVLKISDLNMPQIRAEIDNQIAYFGTDLCSQFCGTFDNTDVTTEEMIQTVATAGFCQAYRFNNQINLHFEKREPVSVVQFNAHNMLPDSFEYSESFGARNDYDGVQVTYTDPADDAKVTLNYPADGVANNAEKKDLMGVRNKVQAYMHMMRQHQKNLYAYKTCTFGGADESGIVIPTNRIDVANLYQSDTKQGVVIQQSVDSNGQTVLTTNAPVNLTAGQQATVFVQTMAGIVDNIRCQLGLHDRELILNRPPSQPLSLSPTAVVRATYKLVTHSELDRDAYLVTAKEAGSNPMSHKLTCINYTDKYYLYDSAYLTNSIPT